MTKLHTPGAQGTDQMEFQGGNINEDNDFDLLLHSHLSAYDPFDDPDNQLLSQPELLQKIKAGIGRYERRRLYIKSAFVTLAGGITAAFLPWGGVWQSLMSTPVTISIVAAACFISAVVQLQMLFSAD